MNDKWTKGNITTECRNMGKNFAKGCCQIKNEKEKNDVISLQQMKFPYTLHPKYQRTFKIGYEASDMQTTNVKCSNLVSQDMCINGTKCKSMCQASCQSNISELSCNEDRHTSIMSVREIKINAECITCDPLKPKITFSSNFFHPDHENFIPFKDENLVLDSNSTNKTHFMDDFDSFALESRNGGIFDAGINENSVELHHFFKELRTFMTYNKFLLMLPTINVNIIWCHCERTYNKLAKHWTGANSKTIEVVQNAINDESMKYFRIAFGFVVTCSVLTLVHFIFWYFKLNLLLESSVMNEETSNYSYSNLTDNYEQNTSTSETSNHTKPLIPIENTYDEKISPMPVSIDRSTFGIGIHMSNVTSNMAPLLTFVMIQRLSPLYGFAILFLLLLLNAFTRN